MEKSQTSATTKVRRFSKFELEWTIQPPMELLSPSRHPLSESKTVYKCVESPVFDIKLQDLATELRFYLLCEATPDDEGHKWLSLYLINDSYCNVIADMDLYVVMEKVGLSKRVFSEKSLCFERKRSKKSGCGNPKAIPFEDLLFYFINDYPISHNKLRITCVLEVRGLDQEQITNGMEITNVKDDLIRAFGTNIDDNYKEMCDFEIKSKDGKIFNCHRLMLSIRSKVFEAMLKHKTKESKNGFVEIKDISSDTITNMLHFIYTDTVKEDEVCEELLYAADKYELKGLKHYCSKQLLKHLSTQTCIETAITFFLHGLEAPLDDVIDFIIRNWSLVGNKTNGDVLKQHPDLLLRITNAMAQEINT